MRKAQFFVWLHPDDCTPPHGLDMQSRRDANKVDMLREAFLKDGFNMSMPALVGYPKDGKIQLLSGTHRHMAAQQAGILLPVTMWLRDDVERLWGTDEWSRLIQDIPVNNLKELPVPEGFRIPPYERVEL